MNRPKFCVGEEVMIRSEDNPHLNSDRTEILRIDRSVSDGNLAYYTQESEELSDCWDGWDESALRKLPPEDRTSWEDCAWNPLEVKA